jgi:hypothetical protein
MNPRQRAVILAGVLIVVAIGVFPPWVRSGTSLWSNEFQLQTKQYIYGWIFSPPSAAGEASQKDVGEAGVEHIATLYWTVQLDIQRLLVQWATVAFGALGIAWTLRQRL